MSGGYQTQSLIHGPISHIWSRIHATLLCATWAKMFTLSTLTPSHCSSHHNSHNNRSKKKKKRHATWVDYDVTSSNANNTLPTGALKVATTPTRQRGRLGHQFQHAENDDLSWGICRYDWSETENQFWRSEIRASSWDHHLSFNRFPA